VYHDSAAAVPATVKSNAVDDHLAHGMLTAVWSATGGWYHPFAGLQSKATNRGPRNPRWSVVVGKLDILVYRKPALVPTPQGSAVNTTFSGRDCHGQLLHNHQADCVRPSFG